MADEDYEELIGEAMAALHNTTIKVKEAWDLRVKRDKEAEALKAEEERLVVIRKEQKAEGARLAKLAREQEEKRKIEDRARAEERKALEATRREIHAEKEDVRPAAVAQVQAHGGGFA